MFKTTGKGHTKKPSGGYGTAGKPTDSHSKRQGPTTGSIYTEAALAGKVRMAEALRVKTPGSQRHNRVTNKNGKAP